jgi:hypothetical protein
VLILGEGVETCGKWLDYRKSPGTSIAQEAWVRGFLTGVNATGGANFHGPKATKPKYAVGQSSDPQGNALWIDNYCASHPLDQLYAAAVMLRGALEQEE